jgi:SAM-dependent methyltransferase
MSEPDRSLARRLARESLDRGDATGWFDTLYAAADGDETRVPWADMHASPNLLTWLDRRMADRAGQRALVVGCGLGDDAEELARRGYRVTAFDISPRAIDWCRRRFATSPVDYRVADLLQLPDAWRGAFDFVLEIYTLQVLPPELREAAVANIAASVAAGGTLLVVARARGASDDLGTMPWPLTRRELDGFCASGLETATFEEFLDTSETPAVRRFCAEYRRSAGNQRSSHR